jgi:Phytanoyl-CoA dioxygenase (PhyH)
MMPIAQCGYVYGRAIFSPDEIQQLHTSLTETTNRLARGFLTPFVASLPDLPLEDRLERVAQQDRAYAYALLHGIFADAQQDPRIAGLAAHPCLMHHVQRLVAPRTIIGHVIRVRVTMPAFPLKRSPWHQDVTDHTGPDGTYSPVALACWMPLVDATPENGALEVIPGTYEAPYPHQQTEDGQVCIAPERLPDTPRRTLPCPAGDVLFLDRFLPHRTLPNQTTRIRWALVMWVKCRE